MIYRDDCLLIYRGIKASWHLCWEYPPRVTGGLGVACAGLVGALREVSRVEVWHPDVFCRSGEVDSSYSSYSASHLSEDFSEVVNSLLAGQLAQGDSFWRQVQQFAMDVVANKPEEWMIVHAHDWHSLLAAVALKRRYGTEFIFHIHSTELERAGVQAQNSLYALEQWGMDEAARVICVSQQSAQLVAEHYSISPSKLAVVHNGGEAVVCKATLSNEVRTLLFAGRMCSQKAPQFILEVMRRLRSRFTHLKLLMAGEGEYLEEIRSLVDFYCLSDCIEIFGMVPANRMLLIYKRADVLCLPSISEPFGLVATEAAQHGLSVLLSDRCGVSELLVSAPVIEQGNVDQWVGALATLIAEPAQHRELARSVQKEAASHTWQDAADEFLALYASFEN